MAKNPIRQFSKYFTNLTPAQRREMERALTDLGNTQEITNLNTSLEFVRRKPNQFLPIPQIRVTALVRGALLEWNPLADQRIAAYEIRTSNDPNFADFSNTITVGTSALIEGLDQTTFVKIRGLRGSSQGSLTSNTQGAFSDTVTILPKVFSLNARSQEAFYVTLGDTTPVTVLGGSGSTFEYTPINPEGFSMYWGSVYIYGDPDVAAKGTPEITMKLISKVVNTGAETEIWRNTASDYFGTYNIGPAPISHPDAQQTIQVRLDVQDQVPTNKFYVTEVRYAHLSAIELGTQTTSGTP
jgi:hypothetical protein